MPAERTDGGVDGSDLAGSHRPPPTPPYWGKLVGEESRCRQTAPHATAEGPAGATGPLPGAEGAPEHRASPAGATGPPLMAVTVEPWLPLGVGHEGKPHEHEASTLLPASQNPLFQSRKMGEFSIGPDPTCPH